MAIAIPFDFRETKTPKGRINYILGERFNSYSKKMTKLNSQALEKEIQAYGAEVFREAQDSSFSLFDPKFYAGQLMNWAMKDDDFKVSLFRFIDVLPTLSTSESVIRHAQEYFESSAERIPGLLKWGLNLGPQSISAVVASRLIRRQVRSVAEGFILGETPKKALGKIRKIRKSGLAFTIDLLGEAALSEAEAIDYTRKYVELLDVLTHETSKWPEHKPLVSNHRGDQAPINISVKLSSLYSQAKPVATSYSVETLAERFSEILSKAKATNAFVYLDMEDSSWTSLTLETLKTVLGRDEFKQSDNCGIVLQAYLKRTEEDVDQLLAWLKTRDAPIAVRLVKGAYWDTETLLAQQKDWEIPVWQQKSATDMAYERLSSKLLSNTALVMPAFGSHNIRSLCHAIKAAELLGVPQTDFELQTLYGMAEPIKKAFVSRGMLVRDYAPIGELIPGMGYLVRRLLENTSNEGFLRQGFHEHESPEVLLKKPCHTTDSADEVKAEAENTFPNCPLLDFTLPENRERLGAAIKALKKSLSDSPENVLPIVEGESIKTEQCLDSRSVEDINLSLAKIHLANTELAEHAICDLNAYFPTWRSTPVDERVKVLRSAAELVETRREKLAALIVLESGKQWLEADADVAEAIDFLRYYADSAESLGKGRKLGDKPGENNLYFYEPRGITLVISPWNFPIAIPCGMFAASLVTGNCTILKPAEQTSLCAWTLFNIFLEAGMPPRAASFLPGIGEVVGAYLSEHELVSTIAFTGSKEVGMQLIKTAAETSGRSEQVKRVIAEMGGKNAIIVDEDADLDEAVKGAVTSAFSYQGQKCSACSRAIVVGATYERFLKRLSEATKSLVVGPASDPSTSLGPVIDKEAHERISKTIELGIREAAFHAQGSGAPSNAPKAHYIPPTIFSGLAPEHPINKTEIFGPVLTVSKADSFEEAIELALDSEYALTGSVFSRSPANIQKAVCAFRVGNLYINRSSTGALVGRQPFGGFKKSGVGSKAGGPDYLQQFTIPRCVTENTIRRGFAPEE